MIEGFHTARVNHDAILAVIGAIREYREADIALAAQDLISKGRMILRPGYLAQEELDLRYAAVDATAPFYFDTLSLSSNLLRSLAFGKPAVANSFGYSGMVVDRFAIGVGCRLQDPTSVSAAIETVMSFRSPCFEAVVTRLLAFHSPDNFSRVIWEAAGLLPPGPAVPNVYDSPAA